jgi:hypothetical protein
MVRPQGSWIEIMATFKFEVDGKIYKIDAEDQSSAQEALEQHLSNIPNTDNESSDLSAGLQLAAKQIPIIGAGIPETDRIKRFTKENPGYSNAIKIGVPIAANTALAVGTGGLSIPEQLLAYGGMGAADTLVRKGSDTTAMDMLTSLGSSMSGLGYGKALGKTVDTVLPAIVNKLGNSAVAASMYHMDPRAIIGSLLAQGGAKVLGSEAAKKVIEPLAQGIGGAAAQAVNRNTEISPEIAAKLQALKGMIPYATQ